MIAAFSWVMRLFAMVFLLAALFLFFGPPPLHVTSASLKQAEYARGATIEVDYVAHKPWWSPRACKPISATLRIIDADYRDFTRAVSFGFNNSTGEVRLARPHTIPMSATPGPAVIYEVVQYECLGFIARTVEAPRVEFQIVDAKYLQGVGP